MIFSFVTFCSARPESSHPVSKQNSRAATSRSPMQFLMMPPLLLFLPLLSPPLFQQRTLFSILFHTSPFDTSNVAQFVGRIASSTSVDQAPRLLRSPRARASSVCTASSCRCSHQIHCRHKHAALACCPIHYQTAVDSHQEKPAAAAAAAATVAAAAAHQSNQRWMLGACASWERSQQSLVTRPSVRDRQYEKCRKVRREKRRSVRACVGS